MYKVDSMYDLVDLLEAKFRNQNKSEAAILEMIGRHLDSFAGLNVKESKTDLDSDLWEEVPCYVFDRDARGDLGIVWHAQEYQSGRATVIHESDIKRDDQEPSRGSDDESDGQEYVEVALIVDS